MTKNNSRVKVEITHAIQEESDLVIGITKLGSVYVLGKEQSAKIATALGPEWFNGSLPDYERYKENVVSKSNPHLVKELNESERYQDQLWAIMQESVHLNQIERDSNIKPSQKSQKTRKPPINLEFEVESIT